MALLVQAPLQGVEVGKTWVATHKGPPICGGSIPQEPDSFPIGNDDPADEVLRECNKRWKLS